MHLRRLIGMATVGFLLSNSSVFAQDVVPRIDRRQVSAPTSLHVSNVGYVPGQRVQLFVVLLDALGAPVADAPVGIAVDGKRLCITPTDAYGRAFCEYTTPSDVGREPRSISATFEGTTALKPAAGSGTLTVAKSPSGGLQPPGAPRVEFKAFGGELGVATRLRAVVTDNGTPVRSVRVHFSANGEWFGSALTDEAGVAVLEWAAQELQLRRLDPMREAAELHGYVGGFQAWFEPDDGSQAAPSVGIAQGTIRVDNHLASTIATKVDSIRVDVRMGASLHVPNMGYVRGQRVRLFAVLLNSFRAPVSGASVRITLDGSHLCVNSTDAFGRAFCEYTIPADAMHGPRSIAASFEGTATLPPAEGSGRLTVGTSHSGGLQPPGAPSVEIVAFDGALGIGTRLRAVVTDDGTPVHDARVRFSANGEWLGSTRTNEAGIAIRGWIPEESGLGRLHQMRGSDGELQEFVGGFQAWFEPDSGSRTPPSVGIARGTIWAVNDATPCASNPVYTGEYEGYTRRCSVSHVEPQSFALTQEPRFTVHRGQYGQGSDVQNGQYRLSIPQPPDPPANPDCNAALFDACRRICERLEYRTHFRVGGLHALRGQTPAQCGWELDEDLTPEAEDFRRGYDACALAAAQSGLSTWNHSVEISVPVWFTGHFQFGDPHMQSTSNGGGYLLFMEHFFRRVDPQVTMHVDCR